MKKTRTIPEEDVLVRNFSGFVGRACYLRSIPECVAEVAAENSPAKQLCDVIMAASNGMPRQHVIAALVVVVGDFMEDWRAEEQLLSGPVQ